MSIVEAARQACEQGWIGETPLDEYGKECIVAFAHSVESDEAVKILRMFVAWDEAEKNAPRYDEDGGAHFGMMMKLCREAFDRARAFLTKLDG